MRVFLFVALALSGCIVAGESIADESDSLELSLGQLSGATNYQIGGLVQYADGTVDYFHFPLSKLEFPSDMLVLGLGLDLRRGDTQITAKISTSVDAFTTIMKDSDWGIPEYNPNTTPDNFRYLFRE